MAITESILKHIIPTKDMPELEVREYHTPEDRDLVLEKWRRCCLTFKEADRKLNYVSPYCDTKPLSLRVVVEKFYDREDQAVEIIKLNQQHRGFMWSMVVADPKIPIKLKNLPEALKMSLEAHPDAANLFPKEVLELPFMGEIFLSGDLVCKLSYLTNKYRDDPVYMNKAFIAASNLEVTEFTPNKSPTTAVKNAMGPKLKELVKKEVAENGYTSMAEILQKLSDNAELVQSISGKNEQTNSIKKMFIK